MKEEELQALAKKFGDNYTYNKIVIALKDLIQKTKQQTAKEIIDLFINWYLYELKDYKQDKELCGNVMEFEKELKKKYLNSKTKKKGE